MISSSTRISMISRVKLLEDLRLNDWKFSASKKALSASWLLSPLITTTLPPSMSSKSQPYSLVPFLILIVVTMPQAISAWKVRNSYWLVHLIPIQSMSTSLVSPVWSAARVWPKVLAHPSILTSAGIFLMGIKETRSIKLGGHISKRTWTALLSVQLRKFRILRK